MEISRKCCRICMTETEFNVPIFGTYCRRTGMVEKILVCLKIVIEKSDSLETICKTCAENVERYYDFIMSVKKSQTKLSQRQQTDAWLNHRRVTTYVSQEVADYSFSFLEPPVEKKQAKSSSPFFSYFSPLNMMNKASERVLKTPKNVEKDRRDDKFIKPKERSRQCSRDIFESQSQDLEDAQPRSLDWNLTPDDNILKRVRKKCFGQSDI